MSTATAMPEEVMPAVRPLWPKEGVSWVRVISYTAIVIVALGLWAPRLRGPIDLRYDASVYYVLGTSLAEGKGYRIGTEPGAPEGVQYPPMLPAIVAVHQKILGTSDPLVVAPWLRLTYAGMFVALAVAGLALARAYLPPWPALLAVGLCLGQANTYIYSDLLFTETPFSLLCVAFMLVLVTRRLAGRTGVREGLGFVLASAAFLLRAAGIAVLATWVGEALLRREWKLALIRAALAAIPFLAWQAHVARVRSSADYRHPAYEYQRADYQFYNVTYGENMALADPFRPERGRADLSTYSGRIAANLASLPAALGETVSESIGFWRLAMKGSRESPAHPWLNRVARIPQYFLASLVITGAVLLVRRRQWGIVLLAGSSTALVCTTPWPDQFARYLTPLTLFLTIPLLLGGLRLYAFLCTQPGRIVRFGRWALAGAAVLVVALQVNSAAFAFRERHYEKATYVAGQGLDGPRLFYYGSAWANWEKAVKWIDGQADREDVVATTSPHLCSLRTGLRAVMPPLEANPAEARRLLDTVPVRWMIVGQLSFLDGDRVYGIPAVEGDPAAWKLVQQFGDARVYRREQPVTQRTGENS